MDAAVAAACPTRCPDSDSDTDTQHCVAACGINFLISFTSGECEHNKIKLHNYLRQTVGAMDRQWQRQRWRQQHRDSGSGLWNMVCSSRQAKLKVEAELVSQASTHSAPETAKLITMQILCRRGEIFHYLLLKGQLLLLQHYFMLQALCFSAISLRWTVSLPKYTYTYIYIHSLFTICCRPKNWQANWT